MQKYILLVDDEAVILYALQAKLRVEGFSVIAVEDGEKAWKQLASIKPHVLVVDLLMPHVDGWELIARVRGDEELKEIPIVVISHLDDAESKKRAKELGVDLYLEKSSYTLDDIVEKIKNAAPGLK